MTASAQWHAHGHYFPSHIEATLWDLSCYITFGLCGIYIILVLLEYLEGISVWFDNWLEGMRSATAILVRAIIAPIMTIFFAASRIFIVVESFISLRSVPLEVYRLPAWTAYIPHL
jgi:hypothetical protein